MEISTALRSLEVVLEGVERSFALLRGACKGCRDAEVNVEEVERIFSLVLFNSIQSFLLSEFDFNVPVLTNDVYLPIIFIIDKLYLMARLL